MVFLFNEKRLVFAVKIEKLIGAHICDGKS